MSTLHERDGELAAVDTVVGDGGLLVIEGEAGIGKTALVDVACARASAAGRRVLVARGALLERHHAFGVARQLFEPLLDATDGAALLRGVAAHAAPVLGAGAATEPEAVAGLQALRGLAALTVNLADDTSLAIVIDDAQWADRPSLQFAGFLARRLDGRDIAICLTIRSGEPDAPEDLLDDLRAAPRATRAVPRPLSGEATRAVLAGRASREVVERCHAATRGNPLLVTEVLRTIEDGEDPIDAAAHGIAGGVRRRIERAGPDAIAVARAAAILGGDVTLARVAALTGVDVVACGRAATVLAGCGVLTPGYAFVHPLLADAVIASLDDGERVVLRRRAADLLRGDGAPPERVAAQLAATPGTGDRAVVATLRAVAAEAAARGAAPSAAALLRRALAEPPDPADRAAVLRELAHAERLSGDAQSVNHLRAALALTADAGDRVRTARELARAQHDLSRYTDVAATLTAAIREAPADLDVTLRDGLRADLLATAILVASLDAAELAEDLARGRPPEDPAVTARAGIALNAMRLTLSEPVTAYAEALEGLLGANPPAPDTLDIHSTMWWSMSAIERFEPLRAQLDAVATSGAGWVRREFALNLGRGRLEHRLGNLDAAIAAYGANLELLRDDRWGITFSRGGLAHALAERGDLARAVEVADSMEFPSETVEGHIIIARWSRAHVLVAAGRDAEAAAEFDAGWAGQRQFGAPVGPIWEGGGAERLACLSRVGRAAEARADAAVALDVSRNRELIGMEGNVLRAIGMLDGDGAALARSVDLLERTPLRLELARSLLAHGGHLRRAGERAAAKPHLLRALDLAHRCGARPLAERTREELVLAGARPRRDAVTGRDALTAAEARVARLAAAGRTNRQIAGELFVTAKTVEGHMARIFRKLEIRRRHQIAAALDRDTTREEAGSDG